jgi:hypothetical protein
MPVSKKVNTRTTFPRDRTVSTRLLQTFGASFSCEKSLARLSPMIVAEFVRKIMLAQRLIFHGLTKMGAQPTI